MNNNTEIECIEYAFSKKELIYLIKLISEKCPMIEVGEQTLPKFPSLINSMKTLTWKDFTKEQEAAIDIYFLLSVYKDLLKEHVER